MPIGEDALDTDADLSGVSECANSAAFGDKIEVGIGSNDDRGGVAKFESDFFNAGGRQDDAADGGAAGETDLADARVGNERGADDFAVALQKLHGLGRQAGVEEGFDQQDGGEGGLLCGFEDDGVAGGNGGGDFVGGEVKREIERRDGGDNTDGPAPPESEISFAGRDGVESERFTVNTAGFLAGELKGGRAAINFGAGLLNGFACFGGDRAGDRFAPLGQKGGGFQEDLAAAMGRHGRHDFCASTRADDRGFDVGRGWSGDGAD